MWKYSSSKCHFCLLLRSFLCHFTSPLATSSHTWNHSPSQSCCKSPPYLNPCLQTDLLWSQLLWSLAGCWAQPPAVTPPHVRPLSSTANCANYYRQLPTAKYSNRSSPWWEAVRGCAAACILRATFEFWPYVTNYTFNNRLHCSQSE